jgi:hypothetical protein
VGADYRAGGSESAEGSERNDGSWGRWHPDSGVEASMEVHREDDHLHLHPID